MEKIIIITPTSRPDNLLAIYKSLVEPEIYLSVEWHIVFDFAVDKDVIKRYKETFEPHHARFIEIFIHVSDKSHAVAGHYHRNFVLDKLHAEYPVLSRSWIYQLDDDNIIHPDLLRFLRDEHTTLTNVNVLMFDQKLRNGATRLRANKDQVKVGFVDTAMMICRLSAIGSIRYDDEDYCADGKFISEVYEWNKNHTLFFNQPFCYYNYLSQ